VRWPERPAGLERAYREYFAAMDALAATLRRAIAAALGRAETYFEALFDARGSSIRVINYPPLDAGPHDGDLRAGAHRDYGFLTILRSENVAGGLEVQRRDGAWVAVEAPADAFVVNIGDMLAEWTNGVWVSTLHRVGVPPPGVAAPRRQSLVFFHNPRGDAYLDGLGTTCDVYIRAKAAAAFGA
jgi:isopenicillin N synthase-like dioxygenase